MFWAIVMPSTGPFLEPDAAANAGGDNGGGGKKV